jgi:hypothetical protein
LGRNYKHKQTSNKKIEKQKICNFVRFQILNHKKDVQKINNLLKKRLQQQQQQLLRKQM